MKAVALVGGFGTRLRPLTLTTPKQMLPVVDRTMLEHVVGGLGAHGVDEVILSLGYREDVFREAITRAEENDRRTAAEGQLVSPPVTPAPSG